jgi:hypothetical protein
MLFQKSEATTVHELGSSTEGAKCLANVSQLASKWTMGKEELTGMTLAWSTQMNREPRRDWDCHKCG